VDQSHTDDQSQSLLVLGVGATRRFALPLSEVTRLEKIDVTKIEVADQQEVVQYRGEILPLIRLGDCLGVASSIEPGPLLEVVVYTLSKRSVGIVVDRIVDIVEESITARRSALRNGLLGSAVIHDHVTDLLDLPAIIRMADPTFFQDMSCV
jgi:two-component system chemotaxis sensor kinase CheA